MFSPIASLHDPRTWDRRTFLKAAALASCWPFANLVTAGSPDRKVTLSRYPFQLGVASGDPAADGVVLWTRLAPEPMTDGGMPSENINVEWLVAADEGMKQIVQRGNVTASPDWAHSVHVEVSGLQPDRVYWYQFIAAGEASPVGRTRTAPEAGTMLDRFRFAFASCQHFEAGLFTAYEHMAKDDLNLVVHLGDYIYEGAGKPKSLRQHVGPKLKTLADYRNRHAQYKSDQDLQAAHGSFPWLVTWDDHEVENNYANDISEKSGIDPVAFLEQRAAAYKAYYEHMPLRQSALPRGPHMQLHRTVRFGRLIQFDVLDTRQFRSDQPCGDKLAKGCMDALDPNATMLGQEQEEWLLKSLESSQSNWNALAQQVMMARVDRIPGDEVGHSMDQWAGYQTPLNRLWKEIDARNVNNPIVLTGDIHSNWVNDLKLDYDHPESKTVGTEFVGTSISSGGDGFQHRKGQDKILAENPFVKFMNAERGYVRCDVTEKTWHSDYQVVEYVTRPGAPLLTRAAFEVESGRCGAQQV